MKRTVTLTAPLVDALLGGLATRFAGYSEREDLINVSVTLPQFRLRSNYLMSVMFIIIIIIIIYSFSSSSRQ